MPQPEQVGLWVGLRGRRTTLAVADDEREEAIAARAMTVLVECMVVD